MCITADYSSSDEVTTSYHQIEYEREYAPFIGLVTALGICVSLIVAISIGLAVVAVCYCRYHHKKTLRCKV